MANSYESDVLNFCAKLETRVEMVAFGVAKELHSRLVDVTPYRTGRARASWNFRADAEELAPAPDIGAGHPFLTDVELSAANAFFDSITRSKARIGQTAGAMEYHINNTVFYIEQLNNGSSRQAPAGFFQTTVFSANLIAQRVVNGLRI